MRALLTGASSFTGYWFAAKLAAAGFDVIAPLRGSPSGYSGVRRDRVERLAHIAEIVPECPFGEPKFLELVKASAFDVLCHHASRVGDYRSLEFDVVGAVAENTNNIRKVLEAMLANGLRGVVSTGTVFEANEGAGNLPLRAFSPYGLSKGLTSEIIRHWCGHYGVPYGKFVIPNPFGPFEEPRFCAYMIKCWRNGEVAEVRAPRYVRDNIHVDLLGLVYARFVAETIEARRSGKIGPIGYVETQGAFAERFAGAMRERLGWDCRLKLLKQADFSEPIARMNTSEIDHDAVGWSEAAAWDGTANFYSASA
ncbi:NAD(P)-dependent oxidoreductase [Mesorhizobium sp. VK24D]|uniref:NAD(P)-dependent oxidoreductase n=1 Tax=Mesorhizobium album TaxID=3072314 RepID=A0ABU4Y7Q8_9HYPH|nr:NAD(P)-dependent oxidoreductase [Mesorhizobium sp. VK24D]MDX8482943.1 NAD(P)-dependent oxidoreductase [Mesorhizobium sp. VK24D]